MFKDKFDGNLYSSHGKSKSCGILIGFQVTKPLLCTGMIKMVKS